MVVRVVMVLIALTICDVTRLHADEMPQVMAKAIERCLKEQNIPTTFGAKKLYAYKASSLKSFYSRRSFTPAWSVDGQLRTDANSLAIAIREADLEGLNPNDYNIDAIESAIGSNMRRMDVGLAANVDVLLSDAFLRYASDLHSGRVDPKSVNEEWDIKPRQTDLADVLCRALDSVGVRASLNQLRPAGRNYDNLKKALAGYMSLPAVHDPPKITGVRRLAKGDSSKYIIVLRNRVSLWHPGINRDGDIFDDPLESAIKAFQTQHGIEPDGIVGKETIDALNLTTEDRMRQILANLERHRWLPETLEEKRIEVNIPAFELYIVENGIRSRPMRVVVGKNDHRTPLLNNAMSYIVLSPYWNVPDAIAVKEIRPQMLKDPKYLKKQKIKVFEKSGDDLTEIDPTTVNWKEVKRGKVRFRMEPGTRNSLGRIKFMFPNFANVYLHDTPVKSLFNKSMRSFSHGCVRVEEPVALAAYLLGKDSAWVNTTIRAAHARRLERVVCLPEPVAVRLEYFTAWVDDAGSLQFRKDIYGWDDQVAKAMQGIPTIRKKSGVEQFASRIGKGSRTASMQ